MLTSEERYIGKNLIIQFLFIIIISVLFIPTVRADSTLIPSSNIDQVYYYPYDGDTIGQVVLSGYDNYFILSSSDGYPTGSYLATEMIWFKGLTFVQDKEYTFYITYGFNNNTQNCYTQTIINNWSTIRSLKAVVGSSTNWGDNISFYDTTVSTTGDLCGAGTITIKFILTSAIDFNGLRIGWGDTSNYSQLSPMLSGTYDTFSIWLKEIRYSSEQDISDSLSGVEEKLNEQNNKTDELIGEQKETNENLNDIEDALTDDSAPDTSALDDSAGWLPAGPVDSILNLPLNMLTQIQNAVSQSCTPLNATLPFVNKDISIPCMSELIEKMGASSLWIWLGGIVSVLMLYTYLLRLYAWVDNTLMMRAEFDEAMGVDLANWGRV